MKLLPIKGAIYFLLLISLFSSSAQILAQSHSLRVPRRGSLPIYKNEAPCIVSVARSDIKVRGSVQYSREGAIDIWSSFYVYAETPTYYYIGYPDFDSNDLKLARPIGWVDKEYLLDETEALRTPNKIYRRIIVFDNKHENRIPIFSAPQHTAEELYKTPLFSFFYVYKETEDYYLIGVAAKIDLEDSGQDVLGWIHKQSSREWNTRLAVHYKEETQEQRIQQEKISQDGLVAIYETLNDAVQENTEKIISKETPRVKWEYNMIRYPLLQNTTEKQKRLFQIAFLSGGNGEIAQKHIAKIKEQKEQVKKLDLMFLLDTSLSPAARLRLQEALQKTKIWLSGLSYTHQSFELDINWGLSFFHTFEKDKKYPYRRGRLIEPRAVRLNDFTTNIDKLLRDLDNEPYQGYRHEPKSLYYALDMMTH